MDAAVLSRVFEPFFTTKERGEGTGMGLAAVYGTVRAHQGAVDVVSSRTTGTTFTLYLPRTTPPGEQSTAGNEKPQPAVRSATILLVDDEKMVRRMVSETLSSIGHTVTAHANGREALECYRNEWQRYDLVILDLVMPHMDGTETFHAMKEINPDMVALIASGFSVEGQAQELLNAGARAFIQKPFSRSELTRTIADILMPADEEAVGRC